MPKFFKKNKKKFIFLLIIPIFLVCFLIANSFSLFLLKTESPATCVSSTPFEIYFISLSKSQVKNEALTHAKDFQALNAGGYVFEYENYFHIISSAYLNKNDAVLVQNNLKNTYSLDSEIFSVKYKSFSILGSFSSDENKILSKALNSFLEYYKNIYDIAVSLDTAVYNEISARMAVNNYHNNLCTIIDNFNLIFQEKDENLAFLYEKMLKLKEISQFLCSGITLNNLQTYSSLLKYRYTECLNLFYEIAK